MTKRNVHPVLTICLLLISMADMALEPIIHPQIKFVRLFEPLKVLFQYHL